MNREFPSAANPGPPDQPPHDDDAGIGELLREVGARDEPSAEDTATVRAAVHAEWRAVVQARARRRRVTAFAVAAGVAGIVTAATLALRIQQPGGPVPVATVVRIEGSPQIEVDGRRREVLPGEVLASGTRLQTGAAQVALTLGNGAARLSVRVDAGSLLSFTAPSAIELSAGGLYVDSGTAAGSVPLTVQTTAGVVRHVGTQYQVRTVADGEPGIEVSIREGRVEIAGDHGTNTAVAGERVAVSIGGTVLRSPLPGNDASWQWAANIAPPFDIAGRSLGAFLEWAARETGRELSYESAATQRAAQAVTLGGSIAQLTPEQALEAVLATTKFKRSETAGTTLRIVPRN